MTTIIARASESQHWYDQSGKPMYTVKAKDGADRPTTLRDARKMSLVPSVTTIMSVMAKPGLEAWKMNQMMMAALTLPRAEGEPEEQFIERIQKDSKEQARQAADRGTAIHESLEKFYSGKMASEYVEHQIGVSEAIKKHFGTPVWKTETSFAAKYGYGGKIDLYSEDGDGIVVDFKTKEFVDPDRIVLYDELPMQLIAYAMGLKIPHARCANVFVSVTEPGLVHIKEWTKEELDRAWRMFDSLLVFWYAKTGLDKE
jgi:tRNA nucleotidyltransferase (CCA-adding enzyme)